MNSLRTIIVGDVHGCLEELEALLSKVDHRCGKDRLIFVGDLINKGPHSLQVLEKVRSMSAEVVMGNHEWKFLQYLKKNSSPSEGFFQLKRQMGEQLLFWQEWLSRLPAFIEADQFLVVHGGLVPHQHPSETPISILCRIRTWDGEGKDLNNPSNPSWYELYRLPKLVVFGHWAKRGLVIRKNVMGLDTGCVYGNQLTAVVLPEKTLFQVPAKQIYEAVQDRM
jgi:bis(5'-nucleosyl)-tetraphosphatase (symmetrical)